MLTPFTIVDTIEKCCYIVYVVRNLRSWRMPKRICMVLLVIFGVAGSCIGAVTKRSVTKKRAVTKVFTIDSSKILRQSREGRAILAQNEKYKEDAMKVEYEESQKISKLRTEIEEKMRTGKMPAAQVQAKYEELNRIQRKAKFVVEGAREDFDIKRQKTIAGFRQKVQVAAAEHFGKKGCSHVFDRTSPGLIFVADSSDHTQELIKHLDAKFLKSQATSLVTKKSNA
jgi:Skp family chaperone for outer membrane proteins